MSWNLVGNIMGPIGPQGPPGTGGGTATCVIGETPGGAIDGSNTVFTASNAYQAQTLAVYLNGLRQRRTDDYTETSSTSFTFVLPPRSTDSISIDYVEPPGANAVYGETPSGALNGSNINFTTSFVYVPNELSVFLSGIRLRRTADYIETSSTTFQLVSAPAPTDSLSVDYRKP
jgi:hypothetical protein